MFAHELYEQNKPRVVVTYPGRFQPFHQGHAGVFAQLQKKFGVENVYILTSNDTSSAKSPFNFSDKYQLITASGVPGNHIVETNKMYVLPEGFNPATTIFITAVGGPDADRLRPDSYVKKDNPKTGKRAGDPSYYKTWGNDPNPVTADQHGYVVVIPEIKKSITIKGKSYDVSHGTECRNLWNAIRKDAKARAEFLSQMYARPNAEIAAIYDKIPESTAEDIEPDSADSASPISGKLEEMSGVIASKKQAKDPRYSNSLTVDIKPGAIQKNLRAFRLAEGVTYADMSEMMARFLPIAMEELGLSKLPRIKIETHLAPEGEQATFGKFDSNDTTIYLGIADRHPLDILRTLAHELVHFKQAVNGELYNGAGETGSDIENSANAVAGVIMRHFNKKYPDAIKSKPLEM